MTDNNNIIIDDIQIEVIKKKNIKNLNLSVYPPDGKVKITVPIKMNEETIKKLISSKLPWIRKQQAKIREIEWQPERKYVSGESHYFLCNPKAKRIWINLELAKKSFACLEYIVVHEMVHLLERYHNKRFYDLMGHFMPNWKEIKKELLVFEN